MVYDFNLLAGCGHNLRAICVRPVSGLSRLSLVAVDNCTLGATIRGNCGEIELTQFPQPSRQIWSLIHVS